MYAIALLPYHQPSGSYPGIINRVGQLIGGIVFKAHRLVYDSLNFRLESNK